MYKHLFVPYDRSYSNGNEKILSYRCTFCKKVYPVHFKFEELSKKDAICESSLSRATLTELVSNEYDCTTYNQSCKVLYIKYITKIHKTYKKLKLKLRKKYYMLLLNIVIFNKLIKELVNS